MSGWSVVGCGLIVGSALWAVLGKEKDVKKEGTRDGQDSIDLEMVGGVRNGRRRRESGEEEEGAPMLREAEVEEEDIPRGRTTR